MCEVMMRAKITLNTNIAVGTLRLNIEQSVFHIFLPPNSRLGRLEDLVDPTIERVRIKTIATLTDRSTWGAINTHLTWKTAGAGLKKFK